MAADEDLRPAARQVRRGRFTVMRLHRAGRDPHRVLLIGRRALLASTGVPPADGFGERLADRIWLRTRRGVDLDVLWEPRPVLRAIHLGLSSWRLWRYDAVVLVLESSRASGLSLLRARGPHRLFERAAREIGSASDVLLVALERTDRPPAARGTRDAETTPRTRVSTLTTSQDARTGAEAVAARLVHLFAADDTRPGGEREALHRRRDRPDEEPERQHAVDELALPDRKVGRRLQQVVDLAQDTFGSSSAEITIIDNDRQWTLVGAGETHGDVARGDSLCSRSIKRRDPTLIGDTWTVPELRGNPLVVGPRAIRFYAAHPIESIDGYRIGVLCVWDEVPHEVDRFDLSALRDLALLAEAEIIDGDA